MSLPFPNHRRKQEYPTETIRRVHRILFGTVLLGLILAVGACDTFDPDDDPSGQLSEVALDEILEDAPGVTLDPNGITPLAAEISLRSINPTTVSFEVLGDEPVERSVEGADTVHNLTVLGLYPDADNQVILRVEDPETGFAVDTLIITTEPLPETFPSIDVTTARESMMEPGWTLSEVSVSHGNGTFATYPLIFDANGDVRWFIDLSPSGGLSFPIRRFKNGNLCVPSGSAITEYDMLGREINQWQLSGYYQHHEVLEKPDGNLIVAVNKSGLATVEDHIVELDRTTGAVVHEWDVREVLDLDRNDLLDDAQDWFHMNGIWYDAEDDALIISGRNQGVVKITRDNELVWILAPHRGWGQAGVDGAGHDTNEFLLTAVDASGNPYPDAVQEGTEAAADFDWTWGQHAPLLLPNGNLFVFDNGFNRHFAGAPVSYSRGVEYEIDEDAMTVRQVWQYGQERGGEYYSAIISDVDYLPNTENRMIMPGIVNDPDPRAFVTEVTYPGREVVFEAVINFKNLLGAGAGWGEIDIVYRSQRMPLYPTVTTVGKRIFAASEW